MSKLWTVAWATRLNRRVYLPPVETVDSRGAGGPHVGSVCSHKFTMSLIGYVDNWRFCLYVEVEAVDSRATVGSCGSVAPGPAGVETPLGIVSCLEVFALIKATLPLEPLVQVQKRRCRLACACGRGPQIADRGRIRAALTAQ